MRLSLLLAVVVCLSGYGVWNLKAEGAALLAVDDDKASSAAEGKPADDEKSDAAEKSEEKSSDKPAENAESKSEGSKSDESKPKTESATSSKKAKQVSTLALFALDSDVAEGAGGGGLFGDLAPTLHKLVDRIDRAAKDKKITGIALRLQSPHLGSGAVNELRAAIGRARKAGKKVYALVDDITGGDYLLAAACDQIVMPPSGSLTVSGVRAEVTFYKDLLDKLGVKADMLQVGDYKGAAEPMTRSQMSPEFRRQFESVIDDLYANLTETIAAERKLGGARVKELLDRGLFTAADAKEAGLIDRVAYDDEFEAYLKSECQADEVKFADDYGKQKIDVDFSGFGGMMKLMEMISGGGATKKAGKGKKIAVVYAVGTIMTGESGSGLFESTLGGDTLVDALREAEEDDNVAAIVLRVNSPGGSALASDLVWREVTRIKKPIVASMGDVAASGGYYISMGADKIFAEPRTLTGSIGVVGGKVAVGGLLQKVGIKTEVISRGKNSGWESIDEPFSSSEREAWLSVMKEIYIQFTTKAAAGRKMELSQLESLAQGRIYTGRQAVANKLVDQLGTLDDAVAEAKKLAGIADDEAVERLILPEPKSFFEELLMGPSVESSARTMLKREIATAAPGLLDLLGEATRLGKLFSEPAVTVMPFRVRIR
jgi:protease-4